MPLSPWMLLALMMSIIFIAGFFLDWISIVLIFVPLFTPLITAAGLRPGLVLHPVPDHDPDVAT